MHRLTSLSLSSVLVLSLVSFGCGKKKHADDPSSKADTTAGKDGDKKVKVVTPLVGVPEEVSAPKVEIESGG